MSSRQRLFLLGASSAAAGALGFLAFGPETLSDLIKAGGYYYILGVFGVFVACAVRLARRRSAIWKGWWRHPGVPGLVLLAATLFVLGSDPFRAKILFDDYVAQATAFHMSLTKEVATVARAYQVNGTWVHLGGFLDKRPYFFPFLVSLVHDLTGFRLANAFLVNAALTPAFLGLVYWFARRLGGRGPALLAVLLVATVPLVAQNATDCGLELSNLTMLALTMALAVLYLRAPDPDRLSALVLAAVLLAQSRYESVLFILPTAAVILAGWVRRRQVMLSWPAMLAPFLIVPYVWQSRVIAAAPAQWELRPGQTSRFSLAYFREDLPGAVSFFFNVGPHLANSFYLSIVGWASVLGLTVLAVRWLWQNRSSQRGFALGSGTVGTMGGGAGALLELEPASLVLVLYGLAISANFGLLLFYYWSRLNDPVASRFALPMCLLLALCAAGFIQRLENWRVPALRAAACGFGVWFLCLEVPAVARKLYTVENVVPQELDWEHQVIASRQQPVLFIANTSTLPFVLWHIPVVLSDMGRLRAAQIRFHLHEGTFKEVLVAQTLRPTSPQGDLGVDPDDTAPEGFRLEPVAERRFGARLTRLSRLVEDPPAQAFREGLRTIERPALAARTGRLHALRRDGVRLP